MLSFFIPGKISNAFLQAFSYPSITSGGERPCRAKTFHSILVTYHAGMFKWEHMLYAIMDYFLMNLNHKLQENNYSNHKFTILSSSSAASRSAPAKTKTKFVPSPI